MIYGIGETVLDIVFKHDIPQKAVPGGSTFNAMISLGRIGAPAAMIAETGEDHVGELTRRYLRENRVEDTYIHINTHMRSHVSLAFLNERNDAEYTFYKDHSDFGKMGVNCLPERMEKEDCLLLGSYYAVNPETRPIVKAMLERAHAAGAMIYYDINFRKPHRAMIDKIMPNMRENMQYATVVKGSTEDFALLLGETDGETIYRDFVSPYCERLILTRADEPVEYRDRQGCRSYAVAPIQVVSTIGAGDNFNAGWLYGYTQIGQGRTLAECSESELEQMAAMGQRFAQDVCRSYDNSISFSVI